MNLPNEDLYKIMDIEKDANEETIKKAYRKLARQYHPDRNPGDKEAEEMFKRVQNAYEILSDPQHRAAYDRRFLAPPPPGFNFNFDQAQVQDLFDMFLNKRPRQWGWGEDIELEIVIGFLESVRGCSKTVNIDKRETCKYCKGTTAKDASEYKECVLCDGKGKTFIHHSTTTSHSRWETFCQSCKGTGKVAAVFCPNCEGRGYNPVSCTLEIKIPAGINSGMKICARGVGDIGLMGCGNLYCVVRVKAHPVFQREGIDLCVKMPITYTQAVFGGDIDIPCLDGRCKFNLPPGTKSGAVFRMPGLGLVLPDDDESARGDLLVKVVVDVPMANDIPEDYREMLKKVADFEKDHLGDSRKNFKRNLEESK